MILKGKEFIEHPCRLFVASDGEIFVPSNGTRKEHFTYGGVDAYGYFRVKRNGKQHFVHRLVAECFIPNPDNLPTVDHVNRDKTDNRVENLRWASYSLQIQNQHHQKNDARSKKVLQLTLDGELVREWPSTAECHRNGFSRGHVADCCRGRYKQYMGYIWKYKNEED